jgi:DnaD/phage-associated family protein
MQVTSNPQPQTPAAATENRFAGFPASARATAVPNLFFSALLPQIDDADELRVTLYVIYALGRRKGYPRFVTERELRAEAPLLASLGNGGDPATLERLERGLHLAVDRGSLLRVDLDRDGHAESLILLNTPADRRATALIQEGLLDLGRPLPAEAGAPASERGNVFQLYEDNIGPITPLVADELREAEKLYPYEWLAEAMRESALLNKRSWRYISAILQRWATEGRKRETAGRDPGEGDSARAQLLRRYREQGGV